TRCGLAFPGIDHNDFGLGLGGFVGFDPTPENGVAPSGVGAFYEQAVGLFDVVVTNGYGVFAEGHFIGGHGTAHAKARVGVDIVGADKAVDIFVDDVVFFREALAGG